MKAIVSILIILLFCISNNYPQADAILKLKLSLERKVEVGSSPEEVKKILGKPDAVESGFPDYNKTIITEIPKLVGQLNNSTWFYYLPSQKISYKTSDGFKYAINGCEVDSTVYIKYQNCDTIYFHDDKVIHPAAVKSYKLLRDENLRTELKDNETSWSRFAKGEKRTLKLAPVLCVVFDKGTQVVASCRVYFLP